MDSTNSEPVRDRDGRRGIFLVRRVCGSSLPARETAENDRGSAIAMIRRMINILVFISADQRRIL
jgi:hypothetical protein